MLSPADVEQKTFSTALRGYDLDEVDDFLDEIVATIRELTEQLDEARRASAEGPAAAIPSPPAVEPVRIEAPDEAPVEPPRPDTAESDIDESAIGRALVAAQAAADRLLEEAQSEAAKIVEGAQSEAETWTEQREAKRREAEAEISALASRVASVRSELAVLAGEVSEKLDDMDAAIETADVDSDEGVITEESVTRVGAEADEESNETTDDSGHHEETGFDGTDDHEAGHGEEGEDFEAVDDHDDAGEEPGPGNDSDHLDEILTGVATDLQLGSPGAKESIHDDDSDEGWPDEDE